MIVCLFLCKRNGNNSIFSLHSALKWGKMGLKVVKSGVKWNKVVLKLPFRGRLLSYFTDNGKALRERELHKVTLGRVIAHVHGRIQSHN